MHYPEDPPLADRFYRSNFDRSVSPLALPAEFADS